ncbi:MAG: SDR family oxidoreductase [Chloroherpetonaceae bacterium]|nr:SDR family oxidoreductase [Chloroherpetonaceae bacterium]
MLYTIITGASSGIGKCFAEQYAQKRKNLLLISRSAEKLLELADRIKRENQIDVKILALDLSKPESAEVVKDFCQTSKIEVEILINNAGFGLLGSFAYQKLKTYEEMIELNISTLVKLTHLFLPEMISRKSGGVINVASTGAFQAVPYLTVYAATKAFVLSFSEGLNEELDGTGVTVTALCPGTTETNFFEVAKHDPSKMLLPMEKPEQVVRVGIQAFEAGSSKVISGIFNKVMIHTERLFPRHIVSKIAAFVFNPTRK